MGSSFVEFHGKGFWVNDGLLQDWLHFLVCEIDNQTHVPDWLLGLRNQWDEMRRFEGIGSIEPALDQLGTPYQIDVVLTLSNAALRRIRSYGDWIPLTERQSWPVYGEPIGDLPVKRMVRIGQYFMHLLRGRIMTTAATSWQIDRLPDSVVEAELAENQD